MIQDYGFRLYNPEIGRWLTADPLASMAPGWSPYRFGFDNPISFVDPNGLFETKKDRRQYRRKYGIKGKNRKEFQVNQKGEEEKYFTIERKFKDDDGYETTFTTLDTGVEGIGYYKDGVVTNVTAILIEDDPFSTWAEDHPWLNAFSGNEAAKMERALGVLEKHGYQAYIYQAIADAHSEIGFSFGTGGYGTFSSTRSVTSGVTRTSTGAAKGSGNVLRHYTSEAGYNAIMKSKVLNPSIGVKNARYGSGQYLTDLASEGLTSGQVSRRLFGVPWNGKKVSHFIDIDVGGLNVIKNAPGNYLVPGTNGLPLGGRIINGGATIFK